MSLAGSDSLTSADEITGKSVGNRAGKSTHINALRTSHRGLRHYLKHGGIIAYPTESIYGLGCDPSNRKAVQRILQLKLRPQRKGLILLADRLGHLQRYLAPLGEAQKSQLGVHWPGPHTWLIPAASSCPKWLVGRHRTLACRVTAHATSALISRYAGMAIVSTSANRSGCRPAKSRRDCYRLFGNQVKVLPGRTGGARKPSTIQDLASGKILRP